MNDDELDNLLRRAQTEWRTPEAPPLGEIWSAVEAEAFGAPAFRRGTSWWTVAAAAAAALVVGIAGGRYSAHSAIAIARSAVTPVTATNASLVSDDPDHRTMGELLGRTAVLLAALPTDSMPTAMDPELTREGARLLTTTRLLLDAPSGGNPRLRNLLQDLELVLAQVARLEPKHRRVEMEFIQTSLDEHDLVPRLRSAAADLSLDDL